MTSNNSFEIVKGMVESRFGRRDFITRALAVGMASAGVGTLLSACGGDTTGAATATKLSFANWASAESATKKLIDSTLQDFQTQNNVKINNIGLPFDQMLQQLTAMTSGGNPPDVMELNGNWPYALGGAGALEDLTRYVSPNWRSASDSFPGGFEVGTYKGSLYAVPFSITPHGFWYSKDLMTQAGLDATKPPTTIDQLNTQMAVLRTKLPADSYPIGIDISKTEYALVGFWPWIWTFGGNPMIDDGKGNVAINWADDGTVAAFTWLQQAVAKKWCPPDQAIKAERELMANGKIAFKLDGPYMTGILGNTNPALNTVAAVNQHFGVSSTPTGPGLSSPVTCADIHNLSMSSQAANKQLAWKFIDYLTSSDSVITKFLIPEGGVLPHKSMVTSGGKYADKYTDAISQSFITNVIPTMRAPAFGPHYSTAATFIVTALQEIAGGAPVKARLQQLTNEVKTLYA